jgi:predicted metal-dependent hydrolase
MITERHYSLMEDCGRMQQFKYLAGYSEQLTMQVGRLMAEKRLGSYLRQKYPEAHEIRTDKALYDFAVAIKNRFLRTAQPLSRVTYDGKIHVIQHALGTHSFVSRVQGGKLKAKHEIRVAAVFRDAPAAFLKMIVIHELAHLKEKEHNKAFYSLCDYMDPAYHQLEFDTRLYLTHLEQEKQTAGPAAG